MVKLVSKNIASNNWSQIKMDSGNTILIELKMRINTTDIYIMFM